MKQVLAALLYSAALVFANVPAPVAADAAAAEALREGDMKKLVFHATPKPLPSTAFETFDGAPMTLDALRGKYALVNFWATWCAPCRKEMPALGALQSGLGGDRFEVVTIAVGRNAPGAMQDFFAEIGVDNLPLHRDPNMQLAREMGVLGLPVSVIVDPEGREIARLLGDADWNSESARAVIAALIDPGQG